MMMFAMATFRQSCFKSWSTPALQEVQLKQSSVGALLQSAQSGSCADADGGGVVSCQFVALMKV
jgi:hypothetical protein